MQVGQQVRAQVADVGVAVHGRAAGVHPDAPRLERLDRLHRAAQGVPDPERHGDIVEALGRGRPTARKGFRGTARILRAMRRRTLLLLIALVVGACGGSPLGAAGGSARIALAAPTDLDPAASGDAESAAVIAQLFETLTAIDETLQLRPALAESWRVEDGGLRIVVHLRPDLRVQRRLPVAGVRRRPQLAAGDRPAAPSPLATLLLDVRGAAEYVEGQGSAEDVGLRRGRCRRRGHRRPRPAGIRLPDDRGRLDVRHRPAGHR